MAGAKKHPEREATMGMLIVRHKVKDFATWKKAFDGHAAAQKQAGLTKPRLFRSADDHNEVVILFDMKDVAAAKTSNPR